MPAKLVKFPLTGGDVQNEHVIRRRLGEIHKDIKWLAGKMHVTPRTLYNHINGRTELKGRNFALMLKYLEINENYYYGCWNYARPGTGQAQGQSIKSNSPKLSHK